MILTVGHSNQPLERLQAMLEAHAVQLVVDVRRWPMSRRNPQFNAEALAAALDERGIDYKHDPSLGGRRQPRPDSGNTGLKNEAFRGFADFMETDEFQEALARLIDAAEDRRTAVMCAEAVPWRCHRSIISDALTARGLGVEHILSPAEARKHELSPLARVDDLGKVTYPALV
jgi:uncharacterized protein (DUF488 family)